MERQHTMPVIRASEVGEYVYCARAWWLRRVAGLEPAGRARRAAGVALHTRHSRAVRRSSMLLALAGVLLLAALALFFLL
jgi:CRISPR/Cas system-associated exonuclease Cas4 (RecB family)